MPFIELTDKIIVNTDHISCINPEIQERVDISGREYFFQIRLPGFEVPLNCVFNSFEECEEMLYRLYKIINFESESS